MDSDDYELVDRVADALVEFIGVPPPEAMGFAQRMAKALGLSKENQWVPYTDSGERLEPLRRFGAAKSCMASDPSVIRVDREYRFVSRFFNPSRGD